MVIDIAGRFQFSAIHDTLTMISHWLTDALTTNTNPPLILCSPMKVADIYHWQSSRVCIISVEWYIQLISFILYFWARSCSEIFPHLTGVFRINFLLPFYLNSYLNITIINIRVRMWRWPCCILLTRLPWSYSLLNVIYQQYNNI